MCPLLLLFLVLLRQPSQAAVAPPDTLRPTSAARLLSYTYANDLFFRTDYYFTQGMTLSLVHPELARLPTRHLLVGGPVGSSQYYGIGLRYDGFTPLRIQDAFIRVGDRPYAAYGYASFFRVSNRVGRHQRLTTALEIGFIGPAAGGKQLQTAIHRVTGNAEPQGWDYQIRNDVVLGYRTAFEFQLLAMPRRVEVIGTTEASLGTLYTNASAGLKLRAGMLHPYFDGLNAAEISHSQPPKWQLYALATVEARLIGYDATLQGGLLNGANPYVLSASNISRTVVRSSGGAVLVHNGLSFSATATWVSPEFAGARSHRWGQLGLIVAF